MEDERGDRKENTSLFDPEDHLSLGRPMTETSSHEEKARKKHQSKNTTTNKYTSFHTNQYEKNFCLKRQLMCAVFSDSSFLQDIVGLAKF